MPRTPTPVSSFGPELMTALMEGAKRRFEIPMTYAGATKFRQRIYQLRTAMRLSGHEMAEAVSRTRVQILWGTAIGNPPVVEKANTKKVKWPGDSNTPCMLVISPYDSEFGDALAKAGIRAAELNDDILAGAPADALSAYVPKED